MGVSLGKNKTSTEEMEVPPFPSFAIPELSFQTFADSQTDSNVTQTSTPLGFSLSSLTRRRSLIMCPLPPYADYVPIIVSSPNDTETRRLHRPRPVQPLFDGRRTTNSARSPLLPVDDTTYSQPSTNRSPDTHETKGPHGAPLRDRATKCERIAYAHTRRGGSYWD